MAISRTELFFEPGPDLKATSEQLEVTNCTEHTLRLRKLDVASAQDQSGFGVFTLSREAAALRGAQLRPGTRCRSSSSCARARPAGSSRGRCI